MKTSLFLTILSFAYPPKNTVANFRVEEMFAILRKSEDSQKFPAR